MDAKTLTQNAQKFLDLTSLTEFEVRELPIHVIPAAQKCIVSWIDDDGKLKEVVLFEVAVYRVFVQAIATIVAVRGAIAQTARREINQNDVICTVTSSAYVDKLEFYLPSNFLSSLKLFVRSEPACVIL